MQPTPSDTSSPSQGAQRGFPDPSLTLVEFSDEGLGVLLAMKTERDAANRRIVLSKVVYIRLQAKDWGFMAYPEAWVQQDAEGLFIATEPKSGKPFRHPSRRRYEVVFLGKDLFEAAIQCLKERQAGVLYEMIAASFGVRPGFSVESGCLLAPDDYAAEKQDLAGDAFVPPPPAMAAAKAGA